MAKDEKIESEGTHHRRPRSSGPTNMFKHAADMEEAYRAERLGDESRPKRGMPVSDDLGIGQPSVRRHVDLEYTKGTLGDTLKESARAPVQKVDDSITKKNF